MTIQIKNADQIRADFITFMRAAIEENGGPNVTDYNIGSVLDVLVEAFADVLENYYFDLFQITKNSLENIYNGFNFYKIPGKKALVTIYIYIDAPYASLTPTFFNIPRGTLVSTEDGSTLFEITDDYVQPSSLSLSGEFAGKTEYIVHGICTEPGIDGNIAENLLTKFATSITNINDYPYWIRNSSASGGTASEDEENMKLRFQKYLISLRRGTKEAIEYALVTNAAFTGLLYSINEYRPLTVIKQYSTSVDTENYDLDLTYQNKFYPSYSLLTDVDASGTDPYYLYIGSDEKFNNLLVSTQYVPAGVDADSYIIVGLEYYNSASETWEQADILNFTVPFSFTVEQYITWQIANASEWGRFQIKDYNHYFVRLIIQKSSDSRPDLSVYKVMTYPFPGYIDIYCVKNYRDPITIDDKTIITESIDNFKAAGVVTTVANASVVQLHPMIIINTTNLTRSLIPSDLIESIRADIIAFANTKSVGIDFSRNDLYSYLYSRYSQYGNLFIFYKYDPSIHESLTDGIFREGFRDSILEAGVNEKIDLLLSDIYIIKNLNVLENTFTGFEFADGGGSYNDYYQDPYTTTLTRSDLYLAF